MGRIQERADDYESRRAHLAQLSDEQLKARFQDIQTDR